MARCRHPILQVEEFNALGMVVHCLKCRLSYQTIQDDVEDSYFYFTHIVPGREERDLIIYVRGDLFDSWPRQL